MPSTVKCSADSSIGIQRSLRHAPCSTSAVIAQIGEIYTAFRRILPPDPATSRGYGPVDLRSRELAMTDSTIPVVARPLMQVTTAVYTPDPQLRTPGRLVREMFRDLAASRELAWRLCIRNIAAQYRQSALGYFWAVASPLMTSVLFILLNSANLLRPGDIDVPYPVYVILGTVAFAFFQDALNMPLNVVTGARGLLPKINFPREALLLAGLAQILFNFAVKTTLVIGILLVFRVRVPITAVLVVIPLTGLLLIGLAVGILLVPFGALFQDVGHALGVVASSLVFLTPAAYTPPREGLLGLITAWSPLTPLILTTRELIVLGTSIHFATTAMLVAASIPVVFFAWVAFRLAMPIVVERMGS